MSTFDDLLSEKKQTVSVLKSMTSDAFVNENPSYLAEDKHDEFKRKIAEIKSIETNETLQLRLSELEQVHNKMREEYDNALDMELRRNTKLVTARLEQSRKIVKLLDKVTELDSEIASLNSRTKRIHEEGYEIICVKDEEIAWLKSQLKQLGCPFMPENDVKN